MQSMELIHLDEQIITENKIKIACSHTSFTNRERIQFSSISDLEKRVKNLRKQFRDKKVSLAKTHTLTILKNYKDEYTEAVKVYNNTFDQLLVGWTNKLHVGLYSGYGIHDEYYLEVLQPLEFSLQKMFYRDKILSKIQEIEHRLNTLENDIKHGTEFVKVWI